MKETATNTSLWIYGAGEGGRRALASLPPGWTLCGFLDSSPARHGETLEGYTIHAPQEALASGGLILIASAASEEIRAGLRAMGCAGARVRVLDTAVRDGRNAPAVDHLDPGAEPFYWMDEAAVAAHNRGERQVAPQVEDIRPDHRGRYALAARELPAGAHVLDIACGIGYGSALLARAGKDLRLTAVDRSADALAYGKKHYKDAAITFRQGDVYTVELPAAGFDAVVSFETIEHLDDAAGFVARLARWCRPGGMLLLSTPNEIHLPFSKQRFRHHVRHFTPEELTALLAAAGFAVEAAWSQRERTSEDVVAGWEGLWSIVRARRVTP